MCTETTRVSSFSLYNESSLCRPIYQNIDDGLHTGDYGGVYIDS